jgi:hypothetical protein
MTKRAIISKKSCEGTSALEIIIVVVIFGVVLFALFGVFSSGDASAGYLSAVTTHQGRSRQVIEKLSRELIDARVLGLAAPPGLPTIDFQIPVDADADGDVMTDDGLIEWGAPEVAGPTLGSFVRLAFEQSGTLSEPADGFDYNRDGDQLDIFRLGRIVRTTQGGFRTQLGDIDVVVDQADPTADLDGDGQGDPLFSFNGVAEIDLRLFTVNRNIDGPPRIESFDSRINLRNPQF